MKSSIKKRYVIIPAVVLALLLMGKILAPYLIWLPAMNVSQTLLGWWPASWKEEVLLHDGSKIIVKRSQTRGGGYEIGQDVPVNKHTFSFVLPDTGQQITWQTTIGPKFEDTELQPLALDVVEGIPYLVTTTNLCIAYNKWKRPNPPYVILKYADNKWQQMPLADLPLQIRKANMATNCYQLKQERLLSRRFGVVSAEEINRINTESKNKWVQYRKVFVREPLDQKYIGCGELIHSENNHWLGIENFLNQPNLDLCIEYCERKEVSYQNCPCEKIFMNRKKEQ